MIVRLAPRTKTQTAILSLCAAAGLLFGAAAHAVEEPPHPAALDDAIIAAAKRHGVPEHLVRRIIMRESKYNPLARNHLYWGLMQISYPTAKSMGFKGTREELLNPVVNLRYAVPYLANAFVIAGKQEDAAVRLYAAGYYYTARTRGLLSVLRTADSPPLSGEPDLQPVLAANAVAQPPQSVGIFGALFGPGEQPTPTPQVAAYAADASGPTPPTSSQAVPPSTRTNAVAPAGTFNGATVAMVASRNGEMAPPKKWTHDGGMMVMARGEQGLDQVADRGRANDNVPRKSARRHPQKITLVATLDVAPSSAQAYAPAPGQDSRFAASAPQSAIVQALSGQAPADQPVAPQVDANGQPVSSQPSAAAPEAQTPPAAKPGKRTRTRLARHHKPGEPRTQEARVERPAADPAPASTPPAQ